jgi:hypothetical protein
MVVSTQASTKVEGCPNKTEQIFFNKTIVPNIMLPAQENLDFTFEATREESGKTRDRNAMMAKLGCVGGSCDGEARFSGHERPRKIFRYY